MSSSVPLTANNVYSSKVIIIGQDPPNEILWSVSTLLGLDFLRLTSLASYPYFSLLNAEIEGTDLIYWPLARFILINPLVGLFSTWQLHECTYEMTSNEMNEDGEFDILARLGMIWQFAD